MRSIPVFLCLLIMIGCTNMNNDEKPIDNEESNSDKAKEEPLIDVRFDIFETELLEYEYNNEYVNEPYFDEGYVNKVDPTLFIIEMANYSDKSVEIEIDYEIITYRNEIEFGIDKADIVEYKPEFDAVFKGSKKVSLEIGEAVDEVIFSAETFPRISISINEIKINGNLYEYSIESYEYENDAFDFLEDNDHLLKMLGVILE
ncbi:hypothetical protein QBE53_10445 [Vallitaleaceae bacterium 9-2]